MKTKSLSQRLEAYFRREHSAWISGGQLERLAIQYTKYKPSTVSRRLRELAEDGVLESEMRKGTVHYRLKNKQLTLV